MILGRVQGQVVCTIKHEAFVGHRMLLLDRIDAAGKELGGYLVAVDTVGATVGQTVLVIDEGNSARQVLGDPCAPTRTAGLPVRTAGLPIRSVIVGIVDEVHMIDSGRS
ncbi:MAG: EutN/CcmL family microcompartment protein [Planctomycetes bacterium]|nr:EutN/CcmL family microcompartment protein [Planctomycetota bacterium]